MWILLILLQVVQPPYVDLGLQWTRKRRRRTTTKNAFAKDCAVLEVGVLRKMIAVDKEIVLGEVLIDTKVTKEVLDQKGSLTTLVWILPWIEQVTWIEQASHSK
jgi:hypothetical protein